MIDKRNVLWAQWTKDGKIVETIRGSTEHDVFAKLGWESIKHAINHTTIPQSSNTTVRKDNEN